MLEGWEKMKGNWEVEVRNLKAMLNIHAYIKSNTGQFHPFFIQSPRPLAPQDPSHFCRAFFCILKHFRWNLLRIHLSAMLLICYQELCPTIQMRSKSLQKTGISDSMIIWTVDFNTPLKQIQLISGVNS